MLVFNLCKQNQDHFTYTFLQAFTLFYKFIICTRYSAARRLPLYNHARKVWLLYINFTYFSIVLPPSFCTEYLLPLKFVFHVKTSSIEGLCPLKVLFQGLLSLNFLPLKVFFHWRSCSIEVLLKRRSPSIEVLLPWKVFFLWRSSSFEDLLPLQVFFNSRSWPSSSFIEYYIPLKAIIQNRSSSLEEWLPLMFVFH